MNLLEITVVKNITKIHKISDKTYSKTVLINCYGVEEQMTITGDWNYVRKYKIGYTWLV